MSKRKKYNCDRCEDTGYWSNPFDEQFRCDCKKKKYKRANYRGFVLHIMRAKDKYPEISYSISDLKELAKMYNCPIPKEYR